MGLTIVVPLVGTWIEIKLHKDDPKTVMSFPLWERGLKFKISTCMVFSATVVPLVGTWIEIC